MNDNLTRPQQLINKYLSRNISLSETEELTDWVEAEPSHQQLFEELINEKYREGLLQQMAVFDTEDALVRVHGRIGQTIKPIQPEGNSRYFSVAAAAAAVLLFFALGAAYMNGTFTEWFGNQTQVQASTGNGDQRLITLPDGTKVWLAANSELDYPDEFIGPVRTVTLKGEAFFDVQKDAEHPFIVRSGDVSTTVLGTSFNISSRPEQTTVTVVTGLVQVTTGTSETGPIVQQLKPGERATYQRGVQRLVKEMVADTEVVTQRREGIFTYDGATFAEIVRDMRDTYGLDIELDVRLQGCTFHVTRQADDDPYIFLEKLSLTLKANIVRNGKQITITGKGC